MCVLCAGVHVVFFFKQKTSYEMRISDWSSDVCSSDLAPLVGAVTTRPPAAFSSFTASAKRLTHSKICAGPRAFCCRSSRLWMARARRRTLRQIGRASRRDRGCQDVEISVVDGSLKKQQSNEIRGYSGRVTDQRM